MTRSNRSTALEAHTILITDSGLGGLSVFNDIANLLAQDSPWPRVRLVYFNAWPAPHRGYNHFKTSDQQVRIFNNALYSMAEFKPDRILIACNTLSVVYPHTEFCKSSSLPVQGIVDHGVQMMYECLAADPDSMAVVFGTPATTNARSHENALVQMGIEKKRILNICCTNLAGWIEREPYSDTVNQMIQTFVKETASRLGKTNNRVYAALCCTHFGYCRHLFEQAFDRFMDGSVSLLNPNKRMAQQAVEPVVNPKRPAAGIDMQIISKALWTDQQVAAYLKLLPHISTTTRDALKNYIHNDHLFSVD